MSNKSNPEESLLNLVGKGIIVTDAFFDQDLKLTISDFCLSGSDWDLN